jgi:nucleotide-binding universal stress UspA family protein
MESVLVGVDRSEGSRRAVRFALERSRVNSWRMTVAYVINWSQYGFPIPEDNEARPLQRKAELEQAQTEVIDPLLEWIKSELRGDDVDVTYRLVQHSPIATVVVP